MYSIVIWLILYVAIPIAIAFISIICWETYLRNFFIRVRFSYILRIGDDIYGGKKFVITIKNIGNKSAILKSVCLCNKTETMNWECNTEVGETEIRPKEFLECTWYLKNIPEENIVSKFGRIRYLAIKTSICDEKQKFNLDDKSDSIYLMKSFEEAHKNET